MKKMLVFLLVVLIFLWAPTVYGQGAQCQNYFTRCNAICTKYGVNGTSVITAYCPVELDEFGSYRPRCDICPSGRYCEFSTGYCLEMSTLAGRPCVTNEHCQPYVPDLTQWNYECSSNVCTEIPGQRLLGDSCTVDAQCQGYLFCNTTTSVCQKDLSGQCTNSYECLPDEKCNGGFCQSLTYNGPCSSGSDCPMTQVCNPVTGFCQGMFSFGTGVNCDGSAREALYGCSPGLLCTATTLGNGPYTCENQLSLTEDCNPNTMLYCDTQQTCECNATRGRGTCFISFPQNLCALSYRNLISCAEANLCRYEAFIAPSGSCLANFCAANFRDYADCMGQTQSEFPPQCNIARNVAIQLGFESADGNSASIMPSCF